MESIAEIDAEIGRLQARSDEMQRQIEDLTRRRIIVEKGITQLLKNRHSLLTTQEPTP